MLPNIASHLVVVATLEIALAILLEATLIPAHGHVGFYLCAAAFVAVVGGYRLMLYRRRATGR